ncbi:hypothetical protein [Gordonia sp. NPDC003429]
MRFRAAAIIGSAACVLAVSACATNSSPSEESAYSSPAYSSEPSQSPASSVPATALPTSGVCGTTNLPGNSDALTIVVNSGSLTCGDAVGVVDKFVALPAAQRGGQSGSIDFDGWHCEAPTPAAISVLGVAATCRDADGNQLRLVPPGGSTLPKQVDIGEYSRDDGLAFQFSTDQGRWQCSVDAYSFLTGCVGAMPSTAPQVRNEAGAEGAPNAVEVGPRDPAKFLYTATPVFVPRENGQPTEAKDLPAGSSLSVGTSTCTAIPSGVRCQNRSTQHGFELTPTTYRLS